MFEAGDVALQSGRTFRRMRLVYKTFGTLNDARSNVIVYPSSYSAQHPDMEHMVSVGGALDPSKYFIVLLNLFGNGLSSSPSNTPFPDTGLNYPNVSYYDAVRVQQRMLKELFGIERIALVYGWSMGAMQAYHWAALFPDQVERIAVVCGSARCAPHNQVFIEGAKHALMADQNYQDGQFVARPERGFKAMGRVYAGWALSQTFYREERWRVFGATSLEDYLVAFWEVAFSRRKPEDLLAQFWTWQNGDISANPIYQNDLAHALASIRARVLLMPGDQDLYFQVADNQIELRHLKNAELVPIASVWGHRAGNPVIDADDRGFINRHVLDLLGRPAPDLDG